MKLKYVACVLLTLSCGGAFAANSLLDDSSGDSNLVNTDTAPAMSADMEGGVSPKANLQNTIASQQAKLLTQMQALQQSMSNLQQTVSNLQGIVNNHEQAIQQMQLQMMSMKQSMASQGKPRPMLMNAPAQAPVSPTVAPTNLTLPATPPAATAGVLSSQASTSTTSANGTPVMQSVQAPVESAAPVVSAVPAPVPAALVAKNTGLNQEQRLYQVADQQVRTKDYSTAIASFQVYLQKYPKGQFADNAHYWLGQLYGIAGNDEQAQQELMTVISNYPKSNKVPDAMLQLGMMAYSNGQYNDASRWFNKLIAQYPTSAPAKLGRQQLLQLQKAGY